MDNCLFFYALKMVSFIFAFSCLESTFLGKYAYPVLTALETPNTLHIEGMSLKPPRTIVRWRSLFSLVLTGDTISTILIGLFWQIVINLQNSSFSTCNPYCSELKCGHQNEIERGV